MQASKQLEETSYSALKKARKGRIQVKGCCSERLLIGTRVPIKVVRDVHFQSRITVSLMKLLGARKTPQLDMFSKYLQPAGFDNI
jgi:hypothetical protein